MGAARNVSMCHTMRWIVVCSVVLLASGCSRVRAEFVEITGESYGEEFAAPTTPALDEEQPGVAVATFVPVGTGPTLEAAGQSLGQPPVEPAPWVAELPPPAQEHVKAQRKAEEKARRQLISRYQGEGKRIASAGDPDRALMYLEAARALDPMDRKTFKLIQRAHKTWDDLAVNEREETFKALRRAVKAGTFEEPAVAGDELLTRAAVLAEIPKTPVAAQAATPGVSAPQELRGGTAEAVAEEVEERVAAPAEEETVALEQPPAMYEYTIQPEDVLQITVFQEPELTTTARVASGGEITFPLLGPVAVEGLTVTGVQKQLTKLLETDYLVNPQVQVFIESYHLRNVFVTGAVNAPGAYPISTERLTTVMEAIAMAKGFSEDAAANKTRIIRIENGVEKTLQVNADRIIKRGDKTEDIAVYPDDIIFVPESFF